MEIHINKVIERIKLIKYINDIKLCGLVEAKRMVDDIANNGIKLKIDIPEKYLDLFKTICEFTIESKRYNMEKHQFEPFDKVLVRHNTKHSLWVPTLFGFYKNNMAVCQGGLAYDYCIPYNEETKHLLGTSEPYEKPEPKVWKVTCHKNHKVFHFTNDEFKFFIEKAIINNKNIQWFTVTYDENNN